MGAERDPNTSNLVISLQPGIPMIAWEIVEKRGTVRKMDRLGVPVAANANVRKGLSSPKT